MQTRQPGDDNTPPKFGLRIGPVDALRGIAATMVALHHFTTQDHGWIKAVGFYGKLGVEIFFVISGFVIPLALAALPRPYRLTDFPRFLARRMVRLEPPYLASIALFIALAWLAYFAPGFRGPRPSFGVVQVLSHLAYAVPLLGQQWVQFIYWTLAYEFVFYLVVGLTFPAINGRWPWLGRVATAGLIGAVALGWITFFWALFVLGHAVFRAHSGRERTGWALAELALAAAAIARFAPAEAVAGLGTALIILCHQRLPPLHPAAGRVLALLGSISYSLYLIHLPVGSRVMNIGLRFVSGPLGELAVTALALAVCLVTAWVFAWLFERPAIAAARRIAIVKTGNVKAAT